jgi:THUMP domain-like
MDTDSFRALCSAAGRRLLAEICPTDPAQELAVGTRLRRDHPPALVAAAFEQAALRRRAATKFGPAASRMYFTRDGLEQASAPAVSAVRFSRLAGTGVATLADLCCGIGGDLLEAATVFAGAPPPGVVGVDADALACAVARANLEAVGADASVVQDTAEDYDVDRFDAVFADPSRRGPRGRAWHRDGYRPGWAFVEGLMSRRACVKTSPTLPPHAVPTGAEPEWVSLDGQVREVCLWSPALRTAGRRATVVRSGADPYSPQDVHSVSSADLPDDIAIRPMGRYVHDPDPAITAAHLVPVLAACLDGWLLDARIGYLSSDVPASSPLARSYAVLEELPFQHRRLKTALRQRGVGVLTIKKRGVDVRPEQLRARLDLRGQESATLLLARTPSGARAYLVAPAQ